MASTSMNYDSSFEPPPHVQWWALFIGLFVANLILSKFVKKEFVDSVDGFTEAAWAIYVCLWIRRIEPEAKSLFWIFSSAVTGVSAALIYAPGSSELWIKILSCGLGLISAVCYIVGIYVARAELVRHYTEGEDFSLVLGPIMTFFFSFIYFQYHLYDIAEYKKKERESLMTYPPSS